MRDLQARMLEDLRAGRADPGDSVRRAARLGCDLGPCVEDHRSAVRVCDLAPLGIRHRPNVDLTSSADARFATNP